VPGSKFKVQSSRFKVPGRWLLVAGVPGSRCQFPGARFRAAGAGFKVPGF